MLKSVALDKVLLRQAGEERCGAQIVAAGDQLLQQLNHLGITRLGLYADNGADWITADLACQQAGICIVPLPTFFSTEQLRHAIETCGLHAMLTDRPRELTRHLANDLEFLTAAGVGSFRIALLPPTATTVAIPAGTGKITFTSGSTGQPKGVCLSNTHLVRQAATLSERVGLEQPRHLCLLPLSTLLENVAGVYAPILAGGEILVPSTESLGFQGSALVAPNRLLAQLTALQPDTLILIPELLTFLTQAASQGWPAPASLKFIAVGGSKVASQAILAAREQGLPVFEGYGLSECASVVSLNVPSDDRPGSCGKPLCSLWLTSEGGEIVVHDSSMLGYLNEPASWGHSCIATGDLGSVDADGFLHISGRKKNLLISSYGRNISPEWVESNLLAGTVLAEAVVIGDARPYCVALLSPARMTTTDGEIALWVEQVNASLPDYARIIHWLRLTEPLRENLQLVTANGRPRRDQFNLAFSEAIELLYTQAASRKRGPDSQTVELNRRSAHGLF